MVATTATTIKTTSRRIFGAVLGLCALSAMVRGAGVDDATDHANQLAQAQRERDEWQAQQAQAQRDREQAEPLAQAESSNGQDAADRTS
jgi:hypothetical protein